MSEASFDELIKKPANGNYIYRGESKIHPQVSSGLFREYPYPEYIEAYQKVELEDAKRFTTETDDFGILTEIQHYGGKTNLIDFTTDYYVALFFACQARYEEDGRVILLDRSKEMREHIREPSMENNRVNVQKSIFVRPPRGYIENGQYETATIPKHLKAQLLNYLEWKHKISQRSVYNDIQGFIKYSEDRRQAYTNFHEGRKYHQQGQICDAIKHYNEAIGLKPDFSDAYKHRGLAYKIRGDSRRDAYERAIADYDIVEQLRPNARLYHNRGCAYNAMENYESAVKDFDKALALYIDKAAMPVTYGNRAWAFLHLSEWDKAKVDLDCAQRLEWDIKPLFNDYYENVADFEQKNGVKVPEEIAAMLS